MNEPQVYRLTGLACVNCAEAIEQEVARLPGVRRARLDFATARLTLHTDGAGPALETVQRIVAAREPGATATPESRPREAQSTTRKWLLITLALGTAALLAGLLAREPLSFLFYAAAYLLCGADTLVRAVRDILRGRVFDENFLMSVATLGALAIGEYPEAVAVMLFYRVGTLFEAAAVSRSRRSIAALLDIRPDTATVEREGGETRVSPADVQAGDIIVVKPGERIPLDGQVVSGQANLDTAALTGESVPRPVAPGDEALSGCINMDGVLRIRVTKPYGQSTVARILALVEDAGRRKAPAEHFITKFSRVYTPTVLALAAAVAVVPPLILGSGWSDWVYRALVFLVVSCPCALAVSVPMTFFGGLGGASRSGILIKGGSYVEALARVKTVAFDKTGTLTRGQFAVDSVLPRGMSRQELLETAAYAQSASTHPVARAVTAAWGEPLAAGRVTHVREIAGQGVQVTLDGREVLAGNRRLMAAAGITPEDAPEGTAVFVAVDGQYAGAITVTDRVKDEAAPAMDALRRAGVQRAVMLTGDTPAAGRAVAARAGIDEVYAGLLPQDKVRQVEALLAQKPAGSQVAYVGDGINDAPVLARADVGIAMGALGSDAAIEAADVVIMSDRLTAVPAAIRLSRRTLAISRQNIVLALGIKLVILALGALGLTTLWAAVFADVGVTLLAILNALRALRPVQ